MKKLSYSAIHCELISLTNPALRRADTAASDGRCVNNELHQDWLRPHPPSTTYCIGVKPKRNRNDTEAVWMRHPKRPGSWSVSKTVSSCHHYSFTAYLTAELCLLPYRPVISMHVMSYTHGYSGCWHDEPSTSVTRRMSMQPHAKPLCATANQHSQNSAGVECTHTHSIIRVSSHQTRICLAHAESVATDECSVASVDE